MGESDPGSVFERSTLSLSVSLKLLLPDAVFIGVNTAPPLGAPASRSAVAAPHAHSHLLVSEYADDDEMKEILRPFVERLPSRVAEMEAALERGDLPTLKRLARTLKGSAGAYGFPSITDAAMNLEKSIALGEKADKIGAHVRALAQLAFIARASMPPPGVWMESALVTSAGGSRDR